MPVIKYLSSSATLLDRTIGGYMNEELLWAIRTVERYSCYGNVNQDDNLDSVARTLSTVIRYQQEQITKLQDTVNQLIAINNDATLSDT